MILFIDVPAPFTSYTCKASRSSQHITFVEEAIADDLIAKGKMTLNPAKDIPDLPNLKGELNSPSFSAASVGISDLLLHEGC